MRQMANKQLMTLAVVVALVAVIAGVFVILQGSSQATVPEFKDTDGLLSDLENYMGFENQDYFSGIGDLFSGWN